MSERPVVVIPSDDPAQCQGSPWIEKLKERADVRLFTGRPGCMEEQIARVADATAIINSRSYIEWKSGTLAQLAALKFITVCGIGTDSIDLEAARSRGVLVSNIPGKTAPVVAEHALGLIMAAAKRAAYYTSELRAGNWVKKDGVFLRGKTVGILGTGNIGAETARLCRAIGMNVVAWTFNPSDERARDLGVEYVELDDLLRRSDVVSIHVRLSPQTTGLIGKRELGLMKEGAILANLARGPVVDEHALIEALNSGRLGAAALDVFGEEPLPADHPLLSCEQVVLTPHVADMTPEGLELLNQGVVENVLAFLDGKPQNVVN
ncbi:MAG: NAD(P)-dependent oxidoreductase [Dehalococcoidia bacterium]